MINDPSGAPRKLYRSQRDRMIAGVAGGIGEYLTVDPTVIRIIFIVLALTGAGLVLYAVLWLVIPDEGREQNPTSEAIRQDIEGLASQVQKGWTPDNGRYVSGIWLLVLGVLFLLINMGIFTWSLIGKLWPLILIVIGWQMLQNSKRN